MKTLRILFALFTTVIILTACTTDGISTNEGGETSLTTILPNKAYGLSDVTKILKIRSKLKRQSTSIKSAVSIPIQLTTKS